MTDEPPMSRAELDRKLASLRELLEKDIQHEAELRELTERFGKEALQKAETFITEKSAAHNNLLGQMKEKDATYVTKEEMAKERAATRTAVLFYVTIAGFLIVVLNLIIRYFVPTINK